MSRANAPPIPGRPTGLPQWNPNNEHVAYQNNYSYQPYTAATFNRPYNIGNYGNMNHYNHRDFTRSHFSQIAEDNSRSAFQSIESIVNAFGSVSMMLDSTFQAVYSSFHAVIGVADNFSRLKTHLVAVSSSFPLFRFLYYLYRRLLHLIHYSQRGTAAEAWNEATDSANSELLAGLRANTKTNNWPIIVYMGIILGAPWLIWKLLSKLVSNNGRSNWVIGDGDHYKARVMYNFMPRNRDELAITTNQHIRIAPKELQPMVKDWLLATVDGQSVGLVPANYVEIIGRRGGDSGVSEDDQNCGDGDIGHR